MKKVRNNLKEKKLSKYGLNIWNKAEKIIPGGNGLLSKRPQRYSPDFWPTYYKKSKNLNVWDLEGNKYIDMAQMGVGTCVLGYANDYVNKKVIKGIKQGNNSTLNSIEEYELAKKILKIEKFADQIKFARGGGEAIDISIRLARAFSKKDKILFSGYHGWYDWYLATNIKGRNQLKEHLLPGLDPLGVPSKLKNTVKPIKYNDVDAIKKIKNPNEYAAFIIEPTRFFFPTKEFIKEVSNFCKKNKICLIIDEITSGWRETLGGIYKKVGFNPDMVVFGKGMGNGFPISCIIGKKKYLSKANDSFVSSTSWTERTGFIAANAVIDFMIKNKTYNKIKNNGEYVLKGWIEIAKKNKINLSVSEFLSLPTFYFNYGNLNNKLYTIFSYEMLKLGYLATNSIYISHSHNKDNLKKYLKKCDLVFKKINNFLNNKKSYQLKEKFNGFKRLN
jgi:glutamate-1-semialdehyde 2,1-aminomutase